VDVTTFCLIEFLPTIRRNLWANKRIVMGPVLGPFPSRIPRSPQSRLVKMEVKVSSETLLCWTRDAQIDVSGLGGTLLMTCRVAYGTVRTAFMARVFQPLTPTIGLNRKRPSSETAVPPTLRQSENSPKIHYCSHESSPVVAIII
jgi:hypothetical protein